MVALDRRRKQCVVALQGDAHGLRFGFPEVGRAFDVGKQEGGRDQRSIAQGKFCRSHSLPRWFVVGNHLAIAV
jgi:hypothetical protein